jgi:hypothetical protein
VTGFAVRLDGTELDPRTSSSLDGIDALSNQIGGPLVEMSADLVVDGVLRHRSPEHSSPPATHRQLFESSAVAMMPTMRFQSWVSSRKRFRPAAVSR